MFRLTEISRKDQHVEISLEGWLDQRALEEVRLALARYGGEGVAAVHILVDHTLSVHPGTLPLLRAMLGQRPRAVFRTDSEFLREMFGDAGLEVAAAP